MERKLDQIIIENMTLVEAGSLLGEPFYILKEPEDNKTPIPTTYFSEEV